jgi:tetratricopeptide (TPR) repeat protein
MKAMLTGSIAGLGSHYVITLEAANCTTGDVIAREQVEAATKEGVLQELGSAVSSLRGKLGESLGSIEKFDVPIVQATTSSLEALRNYSIGAVKRNRGSEIEAITLMKRAIELDPHFASAYNALSAIYGNIGEFDLSEDYARMAFDRRDRVSEREKYGISYQYYNRVTGQLDKAIAVLELWKHSYPRDYAPANALANLYNRTGRFQQAVEEAQEALRRDPGHPYPYSNLAFGYRGLNRYTEARQTGERAVQLKIETAPTRRLLFQMCLIEGDAAAAESHLNWAAGKPREYEMVAARAQIAAYFGRLQEARELYRQAREMALRGNFREIAASVGASEALTETAFLNFEQARLAAGSVLQGEPSRMSKVRAIVALPSAGQDAEVDTLLREALQRYPDDTLLNAFFVPLIQGAGELKRGNPKRSIELLQATRPYELGPIPFWSVYLRGEAYLEAGAAGEAAAEFQSILDRRGADPFSPLCSLAWLGLARAGALAGDIDRSRKAYEKFFSIWEDADKDLVILRRAREGYGNHRRGL